MAFAGPLVATSADQREKRRCSSSAISKDQNMQCMGLEEIHVFGYQVPAKLAGLDIYS